MSKYFWCLNSDIYRYLSSCYNYLTTMWWIKLCVIFIFSCCGVFGELPFSIHKIIFPTLGTTTIKPPNQHGCRCVAIDSCPTATGMDLRIVNQGTEAPCLNGQTWCCGQILPLCGTRKNINAPEQPPGTARDGDHPWQVAILLPNNTCIGSGVLIDSNHVLTVAHKVDPKKNITFKLRLGDWNIAENDEKFLHKDYNPLHVFIHPMYNSKNLNNDIAVVRLNGKVPLETSPNINTACLPKSTPEPGSRCYVAGWGTSVFRSFKMKQSILKVVDVPIVEQMECQNRLRTTRLGENFILNPESFICAGGEAGKDACTDDGGAPLMCLSKNGQWEVIGLVDWGIGCADPMIPGVYTNVRNYYSWINNQTKVM